jgi:hypothetical protein
VRDSDANFGWIVRYTEHEWAHPKTDESRFIDIVLQNRFAPSFVVAECKRVQPSAWTFLRPRGSPDIVRSKVMISYQPPAAPVWALTGWEDVAASLSSAESGFCVMPGDRDSNSRGRPILERMAKAACGNPVDSSKKRASQRSHCRR